MKLINHSSSVVGRFISVLLISCMLLLSGCSSFHASEPVPRFALQPSELGHELMEQQRLTFSFGPFERTLDAYLEVDSQSVRLAALMAGQTAMGFDWDGQTMQKRRAEWMPDVVDAAQVLSDLQLTLWPVSALRAQLPEGWNLLEVAAQGDEKAQRRLIYDGQIAIVVSYDAPCATGQPCKEPSRVRLENRATGYQLLIESVPNQ